MEKLGSRRYLWVEYVISDEDGPVEAGCVPEGTLARTRMKGDTYRIQVRAWISPRDQRLTVSIPSDTLAR